MRAANINKKLKAFPSSLIHQTYPLEIFCCNMALLAS